MNELPELVFQCVQDCNDLDAISIGALMRSCANSFAIPSQHRATFFGMSCRCHHAIGCNAGGEYELLHSFTTKGSHPDEFSPRPRSVRLASQRPSPARKRGRSLAPFAAPPSAPPAHERR